MRKVLTAVLLAGCILTACGGKPETSVSVVTEAETTAGEDKTSEAEIQIDQTAGETKAELSTENPAGSNESVSELEGKAPSASGEVITEIPAEAEVSKEGPQASGEGSNVPGAPSGSSVGVLSQAPGEGEPAESGTEKSPAPGQNAPQPAAESDSEVMGVVTGEVVDAAMNTVTVRSEVDGQEYTFLTADAETSLAEGLLIGNSVEILYQGVLNGTDTTDVTVLLVTDNEKKTITGTVTAEAMSTIRILTEDGRELSFSKEMAEVMKKEDAPGLEGCQVTLEYTGEIFDLDTTFAYVWAVIQTD